MKKSAPVSKIFSRDRPFKALLYGTETATKPFWRIVTGASCFVDDSVSFGTVGSSTGGTSSLGTDVTNLKKFFPADL